MSYIIVDTEYTTWPGALESGWAEPNQYREIVQIGAIKVDDNFKEQAFLNVIIRPTINPILSDLFIRLTTLTQEKVDVEGVGFESALNNFFEFCVFGKLPIICMNADEGVFRENCNLNHVTFPFNEKWHRLRPFLEDKGVDTITNASGDLHKLTPMPLNVGHTHYALHDVRSMACWLGYAKSQGDFVSISELPTGVPAFDPRSKKHQLATATRANVR